MSVRQFTSDVLSMTVCVNENNMNLCIRGTYASMTREQASGRESGGAGGGGEGGQKKHLYQWGEVLCVQHQSSTDCHR